MSEAWLRLAVTTLTFTCHIILHKGAAHPAPKQWLLTKNESINLGITSFESWKQNLIYILSLDANFAHFMRDDFSWGRKSSSTHIRSLVNDSAIHPRPRAVLQRRNAYISNSCWDKLLIFAPLFYETRR